MPSLIARIVKAGARLTIRHQPKSAESLVRHLRLPSLLLGGTLAVLLGVGGGALIASAVVAFGCSVKYSANARDTYALAIDVPA